MGAECVLDKEESDTLHIRYNLSLVFISRLGLYVAGIAYEHGYACSYIDSTGDRVQPLPWTGQGRYLNTSLAISGKTLFPKQKTVRGERDVLGTPIVLTERVGNYNRAKDLADWLRLFFDDFGACFNRDFREKMAIVQTDKCPTLQKAVTQAINDLESLQSYVGKFENVLSRQEHGVLATGDYHLLTDKLYDKDFAEACITECRKAGIRDLQHVCSTHNVASFEDWFKRKKGFNKLQRELLAGLVVRGLFHFLNMESFLCSRANLLLLIQTLKREWLNLHACTQTEAEGRVMVQVEKLAKSPGSISDALSLPAFEVQCGPGKKTLRVCIVGVRRKITYPGFADFEGNYNVEVCHNGTNRVRNPWFSTTVAAYLEERYVKVWGVCAFTPVQLVRSAKNVHVFKSNNLCESSFKESKALDKAFTEGGSKTLPEFMALKALDDQNRFCSFGKGMLRAGTSNVVVNPTPQEETAQVPVQETQWSAASAVSFHHLRRISGFNVKEFMIFICPWVAKTGVEDILRSIRSGLQPAAKKLLQLLLECSLSLAWLHALDTSGLAAYNMIHGVLRRANNPPIITEGGAPRTVQHAVFAVLDSFASSRKYVPCMKENHVPSEAKIILKTLHQ